MIKWPWLERTIFGSPEPLVPPEPPPHPEAANIATARELVSLGQQPAAVADWLVRQCPGVFPDAAAALAAIQDPA